MTARSPDASRSPSVAATVFAGAILMLATMPGRTHGLGLITEPLLADTGISHDSYAQINLWATLLGSAACLPFGFWLDRKGPRAGALLLLPSLALVVALMAWIPRPGWWGLAGLIFLTRALGQGALSVLSISVVGRCFKTGSQTAAGTYAVLLSVFFAAAFVIVGGIAHSPAYGWRIAWGSIAAALILMMPVALLLRSGSQVKSSEQDGTTHDLSVAGCLRLPVFWIYLAGIASFTLVYTGVSLFNQAILAERGFDETTFVKFQSVSFPIALLGQMLCGIGVRWVPMRIWLAIGLVAQAGSMAVYSTLSAPASLWALAGISGFSGGVITVAFFSIWGDTFGKRHLGRIMGVVQTFCVFASALGPLFLERGRAAYGAYAPAMLAAAPIVLIVALLHFWPAPRRISLPPSQPA